VSLSFGQEFFSDDLNPNEVAERLARRLCAATTEDYAVLLNRLAVCQPNRLTEIIPLFSGNFAR
jgi:hypothetical protein